MGVPGTLDMEGEAGQVDGSRTLKRFVGPPGVFLLIPGLCSSQRQFLVFSFLPGLQCPKALQAFLLVLVVTSYSVSRMKRVVPPDSSLSVACKRAHSLFVKMFSQLIMMAQWVRENRNTRHTHGKFAFESPTI